MTLNDLERRNGPFALFHRIRAQSRLATIIISVAITHTVYVSRLILGRIAVLRIHLYVHRWMRPIVTNLVA